MTTFDSEAHLRTSWERAGQGHVFRFWPELGAAARARLIACLENVDLSQVERLSELARTKPNPLANPRFEPPDVFTLARRSRDVSSVAEARARGVAQLAGGRVAALLVAGGQASRLGYDGPKGAFPVAPVTGRTLFEIFGRRLAAARERYGVTPSWYVMTSQTNDAATRAFFEQHRWFGLAPHDVFFFTQAMVPALDRRGRVLMSEKDELFLAPNGHGGTLAALAASGALAHARERGIETFSYFQVDNPLAVPFDPLFLGLHVAARSKMSSKVVAKRDAGEKVGVLGRVDGTLSCIEYSDLPAALREARTDKGELVYNAGNIAMHAIERAFVEDLTRGGLRLPWHVAAKSMSVIDDQGARTQVEGFKFETFVFDALGFADSSVTLEVERFEEFSPVKNKSGEDSAATARAAQCNLHAEWVRKAKLPLPPVDEHGLHPVEIDPVLAEDAETFAKRAPRKPIEDAKGHLWS